MYAGFWKRFLAFIIDNIILQAVMYTLMMLMGLANSLPQDNAAMSPEVLIRTLILLASFSVGGFLITILYWAIFEASPLMATPGKLALGIKVVDMNGQRISFLKSLGRNLGKIITGLTLNIGYVMAGFTVRKQALHDKMANALVIDASALGATEFPPLEKAGAGKIFLAILGGLSPYFLILALFAALAGFMFTMFNGLGNMPSFEDLNGSRPAECSNGVCSATGGPLFSISEEQKEELKLQDDWLTLIAHFQNEFASKNENGAFAASFEELENAIPGFPKDQGKGGNPQINLGSDFVSLSVPDSEDKKGYTLTKCYRKEGKSCIQTEDTDLLVGSGLDYSSPNTCCL